MPILSVPLTTAGAVFDVGVGVSTSHAPYGGSPTTFTALIDTGAAVVTISPSVLAALSPRQIGVLPVTRPNGSTAWVPSYDVRIRLDGLSGRGRWFDVEAPVVTPATPGVDLLIGVELLLRIRMIWDGRGRRLEIIY